MLVKVVDRSRESYNCIGKIDFSDSKQWRSRNGWISFTHLPNCHFGINLNQIIKVTEREEFLYYIHGSKCLRED